MKICAVSDLHGGLPDIKPCELVLICGDSVPLDYQANSKKTKKWYNTVFRAWAESLPCDKVLFIAGNHELHLPKKRIIYETLFPKDNKITYLCHSEFIYKSKEGKEYKIFGTPYCKQFMNWAFMYPDEDLRQIFKDIPENLDILITHDAPFGVSDVLLQEGYYTGEHIGNKPLAEAILQKAPKIVCHGHLHSTSREFEELGCSKVVNCSIKDETYNIVYEPLYFEIE